MEFFRRRDVFILLVLATILVAGFSFALQGDYFFLKPVTEGNSSVTMDAVQGIPALPLLPKKLSNPPEIIKAVYVTGYSAGSKKYLDYLSKLFKDTEINAVVVDIKGSNGYVSYASEDENVKKYNLYNGAVKDIDALVRFFHDKNIYVIGRIAVFEDPVFSKARPELAIYNKAETTDLAKPILWQDNNKLSWLDPASKDVWDYNVSLAKDALLHGFDEINFDYVRFPSDGKVDNMGFPIWDTQTPISKIIKDFFHYLRTSLPGEKISADLFGQTTTNTDDMGIGQTIENAFESFDYIAPMVYPSHYINGFLGFDKPAEHPYEIIKYSMITALNREKIFAQPVQNLAITAGGLIGTASPTVQTPTATSNLVRTPLAKFRPWLQDFNMGAKYTAEMVKAEIKATKDALGADYNGYMLWNPSNIYTEDAVKIDIIKPE